MLMALFSVTTYSYSKLATCLCSMLESTVKKSVKQAPYLCPHACNVSQGDERHKCIFNPTRAALRVTSLSKIIKYFPRRITYCHSSLSLESHARHQKGTLVRSVLLESMCTSDIFSGYCLNHSPPVACLVLGSIWASTSFCARWLDRGIA